MVRRVAVGLAALAAGAGAALALGDTPSAITGTAGTTYSGPVGTFAFTCSCDTPTIDWGDGVTATGSSQLSGGSEVVSGAHAYTQPGSFTPTTTLPEVTFTTTTAHTLTSDARIADAPLSAMFTDGLVEEPSFFPPYRTFTADIATFTYANPLAGDAAQFTATVTWGDNGGPEAATVRKTSAQHFAVSGTHAYSSVGKKTVTVTITDTSVHHAAPNDGITGSTATVSGTIDSEKGGIAAPKAVITPLSATTLGKADLPFRLSAKDSSGGDPPLTYAWDTDDNGSFNDSADDHVEPRYSNAGQHIVHLQVRDARGVTDVASLTLTQHSQPPIVFIGYPGRAIEGGQFVANAAGSYDLDGHVVAYQFDLDGDGTYETGPQPSNVAIGKVTLKAGAIGTFGVRVIDNDGDSAQATQSYQVFGGPKAAFAYQPLKPRVGDTVHFDANGSSTPAGSSLTNYRWDFGNDGPFEALLQVPTVAQAFPKRPRTTNTFDVRLRVVNDTPGSNDAIQPITLYNTSPDADFSIDGASVAKHVSGSGVATTRLTCAKKAKTGCRRYHYSSRKAAHGLAQVKTQSSYDAEAGRPVTFTSTRAQDAEGWPHHVVKTEWDLDYGGTSFEDDASLSEKDRVQFTRKFPTVGKRVIALRNTDEEGAQTLVTKPLEIVAPKGPKAVVQVLKPRGTDPVSGLPLLRPQKTYEIDGEQSLRAPASTSELEYQWSLGGLQLEAGATDKQFVVVKALKPGLFPVTLTVTDPETHLTSTYSQTVDAEKNAPPIVAVTTTPSPPTIDDVLQAQATYSDPDGLPGEKLSILWGEVQPGGSFLPDTPLGMNGQPQHFITGLHEGKDQVAVEVTDGEGATTLQVLYVDVIPPTCDSSYDKGNVHLRTLDPGSCIRRYVSRSNQTDTLVDDLRITGRVDFDGLQLDARKSTLHIVNYGEATAPHGVKVKLYNEPQHGSMSISRDGLKLFEGAPQFALLADGTFVGDGSGNYSSFVDVPYTEANQVGGLRMTGFTPPKLGGDGKFDFAVHVQLPDKVGGQTGDLPASTAAATHAGSDAGFSFSVPGGSLGIISLHDLQVTYHGTSTFSVSAGAGLPVGGQALSIDGAVTVAHGSLESASAGASFQPGVPIGSTGLFFNGISLSLDLADGIHASGTVTITALDVIRLDGTVTADFPDSGPWHLGVEGNLSLLGVALANAHADFTSNGYFNVGGGWNYSPCCGASFKANVGGEFYDGQFNITGHGEGCILGYCVGADGVASSVGLGVCLSIKINYVVGSTHWHPGFGIRYNPFDLDIFFRGCGLGKFTAHITPPAGSRALLGGGALAANPLTGRAAGTSTRFDVGRAAPGTVVKAVGAGGPPDLVLTGPGGETVSTAGRTSGSQDKASVVLRDPANRATYVMLLGPKEGTWTQTVAEGSSPVVSSGTADGTREPSVKAKVTGSGATRRLTYRIARQPGQEVRFLEQGKSAGSLVGRARGSSGTLPFTPAAGPAGNRKIVAQITENGRPVATSDVAVFRFAGTPRVAAPRVRVRRGAHGSLALAWTSESSARRWRVTVTTSDGAVRFLDVAGKVTHATLPRARGASATVVGVAADQRLGRPGRASLNTRHPAFAKHPRAVLQPVRRRAVRRG